MRKATAGIALLMALSPALAATENLLRAPSAHLRLDAATPSGKTVYQSLTDGDLKTTAASHDGAVELVIEFDSVVTAEALVIHLNKSKRKKASIQVDLLGSIVSADTGYTLLRSATITGQRSKENLRFMPSGARWLMLRIKASDSDAPLAISEIEVSGEAQAPRSTYAFQDSPANTQAVLAKLRDQLTLDISADEQSLFEDAADGQLDQWSLADAALLASGVSKKADRLALQAKIDGLSLSAQKAIPASQPPMARGKALLQWLHRNAFSAGYLAEQTDVSTVLESGQYNCVSSAVLYGVIAKRLGLDARGIEVPDHAFAIVYDGTQFADVETTTKMGFDPARSKAAQAAFTERTGFGYIPSAKAHKRRETSILGLIALIYYNHGVEHNRAGRYEQALRSNYRALSLDPGLNSAVKNALAALGRWAAQLSDRGEYEQALSLMRTALALAPDDRTLNHNRRVIWQQRITNAVDELPFEKVLQLTDEAHQALPNAGFDKQQAIVFTRKARALARDEQWEKAFALASQGVGRVNEASSRELNRFRAGLILSWMSKAIESKQWSLALSAATKGARALPDDYRIRRNTAYLLQEWSESALATEGPEAASNAIRAVLDQHSENRDVRRAAESFIKRRIMAHQKAGNMALALEAVTNFAPLLGESSASRKLTMTVFNAAAGEHIKAKDWAQAATVYESARQTIGDEILKERGYRRNVPYIGQEWLAAEASESPEALGTRARELLNRFADVKSLPKVVSSAYMKAVKHRQTKGDYEAAEDIAQSGAKVLGDLTESKKIIRYTYDRWAEHHRKQGHWEQATGVYERGLAATAGDRHLQRNARATWHAWAKHHMDKREWQLAIDIYERALKKMPGTRGFEQNIRYCRQEMAKG